MSWRFGVKAERLPGEGLRFSADVPVREIVLSCPELDGPQADQYEVIDHKVSLRLARQPGAGKLSAKAVGRTGC